MFTSDWAVFWYHPCKILTERAEISTRISASFWPVRLPRSRWDLGEILKSQRPKTRQDSRQDLDEILKSHRDSWRDLGEILKSRQPKTHRDSRRDLKILWRFSAEISTRSQNLGGQKLAENLDKISSKILARSQSLGGQNLGKTSSKILSRYQNLGGQKNLAEKTGSFLYFKMSILRFRKAFHKFFDWSSF